VGESVNEHEELRKGCIPCIDSNYEGPCSVAIRNEPLSYCKAREGLELNGRLKKLK
jgi:hypothetical protein